LLGPFALFSLVPTGLWSEQTPLDRVVGHQGQLLFARTHGRLQQERGS
jgi:hypothetical protein